MKSFLAAIGAYILLLVIGSIIVRSTILLIVDGRLF